MNINVFTETPETLGIFYDRYYKIPDKISDFMDIIDENIKLAESEKLPDNNIIDELDKFKKEIEMDINKPDAIDPGDANKTKKLVRKIKDDADRLLNRLGILHRKFRFGQNWFKGILMKPKVYTNDIEGDQHINVNKFMRDIGRSLDWIEKIVIDLMNMADQDLNILSLVQNVYFKKIYESYDESYDDYDDFDIMDTPINAPINDHIEEYNSSSYFSMGNKSNDNTKSDDLLDVEINKDEMDYVPVYSIVTSYDASKYDSGNDIQKKMIDRGKMISGITRGDKYTHTLISFDTSLEHMYHYMGSGFAPDSIITNPAFEVTQSIYINTTFVTKEEKETIMSVIKDYEENKSDTKYALLQLINQLLGKSTHQDKRMICSTFVGYLLSCGNVKNLHRDYSLIRPEDITVLPRSFYTISFINKEDFIARKGEFDTRIKQIYRDNIDEIAEYNNILPKILLKNKFKECGTFEKFFDWIIHKFNITA